MKFIRLPNGNLQMLVEDDSDREFVLEALERRQGDDHGFMFDLLDYTGWLGNAHLLPVKPEDVAALTDAPILTNGRDLQDDGSAKVWGDVWWYPAYEVSHFGEVLRDHGKVTFQHAAPAH